MKPLLFSLRCPEEGLLFGTRRLFPNLDFKWRKGEHWGIVGPNGCGKSVLIHMICGSLFKPEADLDYFFEGPNGGDPEQAISLVSLESQAALLAKMEAYVQMRWNSAEEESSPLVDDFLSQDQIDEIAPYEKRTRTEEERRAFRLLREKTISRMKIGHLLNRRFASLSNGETRRTLLARALLRRPRLMLFDAPYIGLDAESRAQLVRVVDEIIASDEAQVMLASVRREEIPDGITHLLLLNPDGSVRYQGLAKDAPDAPRAAPSPSPKKPDAKRAAKPSSLPAGTPPAKLPSIAFRATGPQTSGKPIVEMRNLHVAYGDHVVIDNLDWTIRTGERWLVSGPNGCGKTTLLAFIIGDHPQAYANDIRLFGRRRGTGESIWSIKKRIGWVSPELHSCMSRTQSVLDVVLSGFVDTPFYRQTRTPVRIRRAKELLEQFHLLAQIDHPFGVLSGGEQRLVLLARALVKKPPLLVLDEPCQNLDAENRTRFVRMVDAFCSASPVTLLYVTHLSDTEPSCIDHRLIAQTVPEKTPKKRT